MEAWRIARWREAVPSEFRSIVPRIAFNKDAFSKGSGLSAARAGSDQISLHQQARCSAGQSLSALSGFLALRSQAAQLLSLRAQRDPALSCRNLSPGGRLFRGVWLAPYI
jgi:hypothetical protein